MLSVKWFLRNEYKAFVQHQPSKKVMTVSQWREWQEFVQWAALDRDMVHAMMVFHAICGLGKISSLVKRCPKAQKDPQKVVLHLLETAPSTVPSAAHLSEEALNLVKGALCGFDHFDLAQLLQGENLP